MRSLLTVAILLGMLAPAVAQAPPVPALPDTQRQTAYTGVGLGPVAVGFQLYCDGTDLDNCIEVWINGIRHLSTDPINGWFISSPTGPIASIPRPITDAQLTFVTPQSNTFVIVSAQRPRRLQTFAENQGITARAFNQIFNTVFAELRDTWDKINDVTGRGLFFGPGAITGPMPLPSQCANMLLGFDATGLNPICTTPGTGGGGGGGGVTSVSNADGSLIISPITTAVVASLATGHANIWTALQNFSADIVSPIVVGGTAPTSILTLESTSAVGSGDFVQVKTGTQNEALRVDSSQNVVASVGGTTAQATMTGVAAPQFQIHGATTDFGRLGVYSWQPNINMPTVFLHHSRSGVFGTQTLLQSGDGIGSLEWAGSDGAKFVEAAGLLVTTDGTPTLNSMPAKMVFETTPSGGTAALERMRISSNGQIYMEGALRVAVRSVATTTVTISAASDYFLCLDPTANVITANLPASPSTGLTYLIKDCTGQAATHNITVTPAAGNIDGAASFVINTNFQSIAVTYTGAQWSIN